MKILFIGKENFELLCVRALSWGFDVVALPYKTKKYSCLIIGRSKISEMSQQVIKEFGPDYVSDQIPSFKPVERVVKLYNCVMLKCTISELSQLISENRDYKRFAATSVHDLVWLTKQLR